MLLSELRATEPVPSHLRIRKRLVDRRWVRNADGPLLPQPAPFGVRTPNHLIWGHELTDFMWLKRRPDFDIYTIWSISMLKELNEGYDATHWTETEKKQQPRRRHPWPVLKLPQNIMKHGLHGTEVGIIDQGCIKHCCSDYSHKYREDEDDTSSEEPKMKLAVDLDPDLKEMFGDEEPFFVPNNPLAPMVNSDGFPYLYLWSPTWRDSFAIMNRQLSLIHAPNLNAAYSVQSNPLLQIIQERFNRLRDATYVVDRLGVVGLVPLSQAPSEAEDEPMDVDAAPDAAAPNASTSKGKEKEVPPATNGKRARSPEPEPTDSQHSPRKPRKGSKRKSAKSKARGKQRSPAETQSSNENAESQKVEDEELSKYAKAPFDSPYSVEDLPKLEEFLPPAFLPDILIVHDPHHIIPGAQASSPTTVKYYPVKLSKDGSLQPTRDIPFSNPNTAHLHLHRQNSLGTGHHSSVYRAPLTLPSPLSAHSRNGKVVVAAKMAFDLKDDRELLNNEAATYLKFPLHLAEDWCGYNLVAPIKYPVPVGPVVPKCYGYYVPEGFSAYSTLGGISPILLMEECGAPINPSTMNFDQRTECLSLIHRLHKAGFTQGSTYTRNMVVQPGPLTAPPESRSMEEPSFRLIDFGRSQHWDRIFGENPTEAQIKTKSITWGQTLKFEEQLALDEVKCELFDF